MKTDKCTFHIFQTYETFIVIKCNFQNFILKVTSKENGLFSQMKLMDIGLSINQSNNKNYVRKYLIKLKPLTYQRRKRT